MTLFGPEICDNKIENEEESEILRNTFTPEKNKTAFNQNLY